MRILRSTLIAASLFSLACADTPTKPSARALDGGAASNTRRVPQEEKVYVVAAGNDHTCVLTGIQQLRCWGANDDGQAPAERVNPEGYYYWVSAGTGNSTCAVRDNSTVECFGSNEFGQAPGVIEAQTASFDRVDVGYSHACALRYDGVIECWGGDPETYAPAEQAANVGTFVDVSAGHETTCALRSDGAAECPNVSGLSGFNDIVFSVAPAKLVAISAGAGFACGLKGNGTVACRGTNTYGQAPLNKVPSAGKFWDIAVGNEHACALRQGGVIECWGRNNYGQAPATRVASASWFVHLSAGAEHTCALREDEKVECWGRNTSGQSTVPPPKFFFKFRGFTSPLLTAPPGQVSHVVQYSGGRTVALKFGLGSNEGLSVMAPGYPQMASINCATPAELTTGSATAGSLSYAAGDNQYTYAWSVPGELINTCQQFILKLIDGTYHRANFRFTTHPVSLVVTSGAVATSPALAPVPPMTMQVRDLYGVGIAGKQLVFQVTQGGGSPAITYATTNARGFVQVPKWTLGLPGPQTFHASLVWADGTLTHDINVTAPPGTPDRAVENFTISAGPYHPGDIVTVSYSLKNLGDAGAVATTGSFRISSDATITAADDEIGTLGVPPLAPGQVVPASLDVKLPDALPVGSYYLGILVDNHATLPETNLANNTAQGATVVDPTFLSLPNRIAAGANYTYCAITAGGSPYCWGNNDRKQFATPAISAGSPSPVSAPLPSLVELARGKSDHLCSFDGSGAASCWGRADNGVLGAGLIWSTSGSSVPVSVAGGIVWAQLAVSQLSSCGVSTTGVGYCWGANQSGEVGSASIPHGGSSATVTTTSPHVIDGGHTWKSVVTGWQHACGIDTAGDAWCWGENGLGGLGIGSIGGEQYTPQLVAGSHKWIQLTTSSLGTCGVTRDHEAYCWGQNTTGQLGNGTTTDTGTPTLVSGGLRFSLIVGGGFNATSSHTCALTETGKPYCWGFNDVGQLGDGTTTQSLTPVAVSGSLHLTNLAISHKATCGVKGNQIWCWGNNANGQLGDGTTTPSSTPVLVLSPFNSP